MADEGVEVWSGGVNAWECDEMGHMNVRFWVAKAQEALVGLAAELGMPHAFAARGPSTLAVREQHIRFLREAHAGAFLYARGGVVRMGECDAWILLLLFHPSGQPAATFQVRVEHATSDDLRPFPGRRACVSAAALAVATPPFAAARSLDLAPVAAIAHGDLAADLGLQRIGLGAIAPSECDVFGRMRPEQFIGRVSDGVGRLFGEDRPGPDPVPGAPPARIGGAVVEYRVLHLDWPRAGERFELRSGFAACEPRTRRIVHWMLDPASGRPWVSAEAVVISFDLDTRKIVDLGPRTLAAFQDRLAPGLAL